MTLLTDNLSCRGIPVELVDAREATATRLPWNKLENICRRIVEIPGVNRCLYDLTPKPPATVEYV